MAAVVTRGMALELLASSLAMLLLSVATFGAPAADALPCHSYASEDGSTIVRTSYGDTPASVVDVGFYSSSGQERAVVSGRHGVLDLRLSRDGHTFILGTVSSQPEWYLSRYSPLGKRQWELPLGAKQSISPGYLDVNEDGSRIAVSRQILADRSSTGDEVMLFAGEGRALASCRLPARAFVNALKFVARGRLLLLTGNDGVRLIAAADGRLCWHNSEVHPRLAYREGMVLTEHANRVGLLVQVRLGSTGSLRWTVFVLDSRTGRLIGEQQLPREFSLPHKQPMLRYDPAAAEYVATDDRGRTHHVQVDSQGRAQ